MCPNSTVWAQYANVDVVASDVEIDDDVWFVRGRQQFLHDFDLLLREIEQPGHVLWKTRVL